MVDAILLRRLRQTARQLSRKGIADLDGQDPLRRTRAQIDPLTVCSLQFSAPGI